MKAGFLFACVLCAVSFSVLSGILATGRIPFRAQPAAAVEAAAAQPVVVEDGNRKELNKLVDALHEERLAYQKKAADLDGREKAIQQQQEILSLLKKEVQELHRSLDEKVVRMESAEQVNCKRLADMCGKMDAASAASLLKEMEPPRAAAIVGLLGERQAAGVLEAAVASGEVGAKMAAEWADIIRLSATEKGNKK